MNTTRKTSLALCLLAAGAAHAQAPSASTGRATEKSGTGEGLVIRPVLIDGGKATGSTLAAQYRLQRTWIRNLDSDDSSTATFDPGAALADLRVDVRGEGTIATAKERNPHKLLDFSTNGYYMQSTELATFGIGGMLKFETDQSFDDRQFVYGVTALANKFGGFLPQNDFASLRLGYGRVEPKGDAQRKLALAGAPLDAFNRWHAELYYNHALKGRLTSLEFQYRYFQELDAPAPVSAAGLDRYGLGTIRLNIKDDLFVAYSRGRLPFDKLSDRAVTIGWSFRLD